MNRGFIVVDVQNDFLPGGALAVSHGDEVVAPINRLLAERGRLFSVVVATQDWHPLGHQSFASQHAGAAVGALSQLHGLPQVMWPDHCVQDSRGARFAPELNIRAVDRIFKKGQNPAVDSYSGFFDNDRRGDTGLDAWLKEQLKEHETRKLLIAGLATDYCVKFTVLDALSLGYDVTVVLDGIRAVNLNPGDGESAVHMMVKAGAKMARINDILGGLW